jgi:hypothetical protein
MTPRPQITPAQSGPTASPPTVSCSEAARLIVEASAADVETRTGGLVEVWTIAANGDTVRGSAPRLQIWGGMQLSWRYIDDAGTPYRVEIDVVESRFKSKARADVTLRVMAVTADSSSRADTRWPVTGTASLTAVNCERIVDTDRLRAGFYDLSLSGIALIVSDERVRPGDRFLLRSRFMEGSIDSDVRVARVAPAPDGRGFLVGTFFLHPSPSLAATVQAIIDRFGQHRRLTSETGIRQALGIVRHDGRRDSPTPLPTSPTLVPRHGIA